MSPMAAAGWTHTLKRTGDRVTSIVWAMEIKPGEFAEFVFIGRNPKTGSETTRPSTPRTSTSSPPSTTPT